MTKNLHAMLSFNFKDVLIDEIGLEGLEGIGLNLLWKRITHRISSPVTEKMQCRFWNLIINLNCVSIYKNPESTPDIPVLDRFKIVDENTGDLKEPEDYLDGPYKFQPIENGYGSCEHYKTRTLLNKDDIAKIPYKDVLLELGNILVLVASKEERWAALAPHLPMTYLTQLTNLHYCILELIGKSRENGQMTIGKTNLTKIVKDSKLLFYNRKILQDLDLIRVTHITHVTPEKCGIKGILLRLKRFHKSFICTTPKIGVIHDLVEYLKERPNYCEKTEVVLKKGLLSQKQNKRFQKKFYIFGYEENPVILNEITPSKKKFKPHTRRRYIYLCSQSDESSESEEEDNEIPLKCQYKVGVNLLRQAYERFIDAGLNGLTQVEIAQILGVEFYVSRTICRLFKSKNIVREFLEDKGRQRTARFIAVAATAKVDLEYTNEMKKLQQHLVQFKQSSNKDSEISPNEISTETDPIPRKKRKLEQNDDSADYIDSIKELKCIEGLPNTNVNNTLSDSANKFTLRQLKFANGVFKIIGDLGFVIGYQTLGRMVSQEINEPLMDTKALKTFLQKFVADKYLKIFVIKWPGFKDKCTILICAPYIKISDPLISAKYKEIIKKAARNKDMARKKLSVIRPLTQYAFPRFLKMQKLHEAVVKYTYFERVKKESIDLPQGFAYIKDLIPELTIEVALGNISSAGSVDIAKFTIDDSLLHVKICDAPLELSRTLINSNHLCNSILAILKILALFGLVQLIAQGSYSNVPDNYLAVHLFYVNKHATLIDTTGVWPKLNAPLQDLEKKFHFGTFDDVKAYWSTVYNISTNTTIEIPNRKLQKAPKVPIRLYHEVEQYDNGQQYGNHFGPCGFDSSFYLDIPRLWRAYSARTNKLQTKVLKKPIAIPKFGKTKRIIRKVKKLKPKAKKIVEEASLTQKLPSINQSYLKNILLKQNLVKRQATKLNNPIQWTKEEDRMVMLCKAAINIMSPISQPGSLQVTNIVTKDILSLRDPKKTQKACHRRTAIVDCNSTMLYEKDCILAELRLHHINIIQKYEGTLKKLRILYSTNMPRYLHAARLPMLELVWNILQVSKKTCLNQNTSGLIIDEDFKKNFTIVPSSSNRPPSNSYKSPPDNSVIGPLKEAVILTVMFSYNNVVVKSNAEKIYYNFEHYEERMLRSAVSDLRRCGAIASKEKVFNGMMHKVNLEDVVHCWYKISAQYQRKWLVRLNSDFGDNLAKCFEKSLIEDNLKGSSELNCFSCELQANGILDIIPIAVPVISGSSGSIIQEEQLNSIDIETKFKLKSGTVGWKTKKSLEKFPDMYKHIDIESPLQIILRNSIIKSDTNAEKGNNISEIENKIVTQLTNKREKGATFQELKEMFGYETRNLIEVLKKMEANNIIKRVGVFENFIVLLKYSKNWAMGIKDIYILAKPWLTVNLELRRDIFLKWASVVMHKIFEYPGCSLSHISDNCDFLSTTAVQDICYVLFIWECISLHTTIISENNLFSEDDDVTTDLTDYNMYESPQNIVAFPVPDSFVKYSFLRKSILSKLSV